MVRQKRKPQAVALVGVFDWHTPLPEHQHRLVVVYNEKRKWMSVLDVGTLGVRRVRIDERRLMREPFGEVKLRRLARILADKADSYLRCDLPFREPAVRGIIRALRQQGV